MTQNNTNGGEKFKEILFQGIGEASMCWDEIPSGTFDSNKAKAIGDKILMAHQEELKEAEEKDHQIKVKEARLSECQFYIKGYQDNIESLRREIAELKARVPHEWKYHRNAVMTTCKHCGLIKGSGKKETWSPYCDPRMLAERGEG